MLNPARAFGGAPLTGTLKASLEDFRVDEIPGFSPDGHGEHVWLEVEKRGANTAWVADELARFAHVTPREVGYAGLKDRHAVTRQAFTVQLAGKPEPDWTALPADGVKVLSSVRHGRKLKRGALAGNRFRLVVRNVAGPREAAERVLMAMQTQGVPNYFGPQRFGQHGDNVAQALRMFEGQRVRRNRRSILLSAARSAIFNEVLDARVRDGSWDAATPGDIWCFNGSHARFGPEPVTPEVIQRLKAGEIHPTGPMWGRGDPASEGDVLTLEKRVAADHPQLIAGLAAAGLAQDRRALRLVPEHLAWQWPADDVLELAFSLPPGAYATVLIREVLAASDASSMG